MITKLIIAALLVYAMHQATKPIKCEACGADDASSDGVGLMLCKECMKK
ncbi:hypothetical protein [Vibrio phage nt-1]|uniref:Uncharacterized protein n=1 Tax=Vibrio phage nt-1 TaxID=115992 RepID=A0A068J942_9CAUD|nr:hypothetical protein [Vibrio phage nt-1]AIE13777.1 hypothetical protein [Vibrio phage nt-1]